MLESIEAETKVFIFRLSMAFFVGALQFCSGLAGKLVKDCSRNLYFLFSGLTIGMLLAKAFGSIQRGFIGDFLWEIAFTTALLSAVVYQQFSSIVRVEHYQKLAGQETTGGDIEEESDAANIDNESLSASSPLSPEQRFSGWRWIVLCAYVLEALSAGWAVGVEEHRSLSLFARVCAKDILIAVIFGVICEESITVATTYILELTIASAATPAGLLLGTLFATVGNPTLNSFVSGATYGLWAGAVVCMALPLDLHISSTASPDSSHPRDVLSKLFNWQSARICCVALGFILAMATTRL